MRLRYLEWGPSGGVEVVLLLHDLGESADIWRRLGPRLGDRGYRTIALDLRGACAVHERRFCCSWVKAGCASHRQQACRLHGLAPTLP